MFGDYFQGQTYKFDVMNTISRTASSLLQRGIRVIQAETAHTDAKSFIALPQAMKRYLTWDEIDFVRYLLHHEAAHIKHSGNTIECAYKWEFCIFNALEDLRIESIERGQLVGSSSIIDRGRSIALGAWAKALGNFSADVDITLDQAIVHCIYACTINPKLLERRENPMIDFVLGVLEGSHTQGDKNLLPEIALVDKDPSQFFPSTSHVEQLGEDIRRRFRRLLSDMQNKKNKQSSGDEGGDGSPCGTPQDAFEDALLGQGLISPTGGGRFGGGIAEEVAGAMLGHDADDLTNEAADLSSISNKSNGLSFGSTHIRYRVRKELARMNYEWGKFAAGMAGPLVQLLRGTSRSTWSKPKEHGIRIDQRRIAPFLNGETDRVLRTKSNTPKIGTSVILMVDDSGSMAGDNCFAAWRAASMLGHACDRAGLRVSIGRYSDEAYIDKAFHEPMAKLRDKCHYGIGGGTEAMHGIEVASTYLRLERSPRRVLFFLCDGHTEDCRNIVRDIRNDGIEFYPIMLGEDACVSTTRNGYWDMPGVARVLDPKNGLAGQIVNRLVSVLK